MITVVLSLMLSIYSVRAQTITVCSSGCDYTTVQAAIDASSTQAGDTISVLGGVHTEAGIVVDKDVTITGGGASGSAIQAHTDENAASDRVMMVEASATVVIRDLTIRHGKVTGSPALGGGILNEGTLTLERVAVAANRAVGPDGSPGGSAKGGGIYNRGTLTATQSTISHNLVEGGDGTVPGANGGDAYGGGIGHDGDAALSLVNSTISGNTAEYGSGYG
jgi:hypothetical protein